MVILDFSMSKHLIFHDHLVILWGLLFNIHILKLWKQLKCLVQFWEMKLMQEIPNVESVCQPWKIHVKRLVKKTFMVPCLGHLIHKP